MSERDVLQLILKFYFDFAHIFFIMNSEQTVMLVNCHVYAVAVSKVKKDTLTKYDYAIKTSDEGCIVLSSFQRYEVRSSYLIILC